MHGELGGLAEEAPLALYVGGRKSRNKVAVGEPAAGSLFRNFRAANFLLQQYDMAKSKRPRINLNDIISESTCARK